MTAELMKHVNIDDRGLAQRDADADAKREPYVEIDDMGNPMTKYPAASVPLHSRHGDSPVDRRRRL